MPRPYLKIFLILLTVLWGFVSPLVYLVDHAPDFFVWMQMTLGFASIHIIRKGVPEAWARWF